jgi:hypothetical protein
LINSAHIKQLNNLKVIRGDAVEFLSANIADNSLARFQLFFPDPWHKKKHHKRRIVQQDFLNLLAKKLKVGSVCHIPINAVIITSKIVLPAPIELPIVISTYNSASVAITKIGNSILVTTHHLKC